MSFPQEFLPSMVKAFKRKKKMLRKFKVTRFGNIDNILFHYSMQPVDTFKMLPKGLKVLEKNHIVAKQESVRKI